MFDWDFYPNDLRGCLRSFACDDRLAVTPKIL